MPANSTHPEYNKYLPRWKTVADCVEGSETVKKATVKYLPKPNPEDISPENEERYKQYLQRANFVSFTGHSLSGLVGLVFKKPTAVVLQKSIEYLEDNANGGGLTLDQMIRDAISETLEKGRFGLLVDYPPVDGEKSAAEIQAMDLRANILPYIAENVINWQTTTVGGITKLSMVVLHEVHNEYSDDGFSFQEKDYHRVLKLEDNIYTQYLYDEKDEIIEGPIQPKKSDGSTWNIIPFVFVGSLNNDPTIDKGPLYDIAEINIGHYRNSADFEESCYMVGQATPVLTGLSQSWVDSVLKGGVMLGSRRAVLLPEGGAASLLQADSNTMPKEGMEMKERQMIKIGAKIIEETKGTETAEAARIRFGGQNSILGTIVGNVESALLQCFEWAQWFMGAEGENEIEINKHFYEKSADPQLIMARIQLYDRGIMAKTDLRDKLRSENEIDEERTDEDIDEDLSTESPL